jgi:hypothetical protein
VAATEGALEKLARDCALRLRFAVPDFAVREVIRPATTLFDPMLGWVDDDESLVFCDIGGQSEPGWDPTAGHGSIWRLSRDDRLEAIVPPGAIGKGMIMFPMKSPPSFGPYHDQVFFLGQLKPGRAGAHNTHAVYWVPPGWDTPEVFCVVPHAGSISGGISGALCPAGWGSPDTPEDGSLFVVSLMNCTVYRVTPDRRIEVWLICDVAHAGRQFMPSRVFRASEAWGELAGELILSGRPETSFEKPAEHAERLTLVYFQVDETGGAPVLTEVSPPPEDTEGAVAAGQASHRVAPSTFGPYAGQRFMCRPGSTNLAHTTTLGDGPLPYDADIVRIDEKGDLIVFAEQLQSGFPDLMFQGDRMIVSTVRKSYSTGEFHEPDGSIYEIRFTG